MDSPRWQRIQELFEAALTLPENEWNEFLIARCEADADLMDIVSAMLQANKRESPLLDSSLDRIAFEILINDEDHEIEPPAKDFGSYQTVRPLGKGGMGEVWLAKRKDAENLVAVKFLVHAELSPARRQLFAQEIRTLAKLKHPNIARFYDAGILDTSSVAEGTPWYAMEYVDGEPLNGNCEERQTVLERLHLFQTVCEAVMYAHGQQIVHGDLKPANILVEANGTVKLLDFGIARELRQGDEGSEPAQSGLQFLSSDYASPESIRDGEVGISTDVFSLGVILYEMLCGQLPFPGTSDSADEVDKDATNNPPEEPSLAVARRARSDAGSVPKDGKRSFGARIARSKWGELDSLCLKALRADPAERYPSVEAFLRDIDHFLHNEPLDAHPGSLRYRSLKFAQRNRKAVLSTATALVLLIGIVGMFMVRLTEERNKAVAEAARAERIQHFTLTLFQGNDSVPEMADKLSVLTLVNRGAMEAKALDQNPKDQADLYQTLGMMYQKLGRLDKADALIQAALNEREALPGSNVPSVAESRMTLALLRSGENKPVEAEKMAQAAIASIEAHRAGNEKLLANAYAALGNILVEAGQYSQGAEQLKQAKDLQLRQNDSASDLSETLAALAVAYLYMEKYDDSDSLSQQALALDRRIYGAGDPHIGDCLQNLAETEELRGHYSKAETYEREALKVAEDWYGKIHPETADKMATLAGTLVYEEKLPEANQLLKGALSIQETAYGKESPEIAYVLNNLNMVADKQQHWEDAIAYDRRTIAIYRSAFGVQDYRVGVATANLGSVYFDMKQFPQAEKLFREALQILANERSEGSIDVAIVHVKLGRALLYQRRYQEAERNTRPGYEVLLKQTSPQTSYILAAQEDLIAIYEALKRPKDSQKVKDEQSNSKIALAGGRHTP